MRAIRSEMKFGAFRAALGGFTLLEVIVAMGVFCLAVLGLLYGLQVAIEASGSVQTQKMIRSELESRLARLSTLPMKEVAGRSQENGVTFSEDIRREEVSAPGLGQAGGYWRVSVIAEWKEGGRPQQWAASHLEWSP